MADAVTTPSDVRGDPRQRLTALTNDEKQYCHGLVVRGVQYLHVELGWQMNELRRFLARSDVISHIEYLQQQYGDRTGIQERQQFLATRRLHEMVPAALSVLARALAGNIMGTDETGAPVVKSYAPARGQFDAAVEILDRANIQGAKYGGNNNQPVIDARTVNVHMEGAVAGVDGMTPKQRGNISRVLGKVVKRLSVADDAESRVAARAALAPAAARLPEQQRPVAEDDGEAASAAVVTSPVRRAVVDDDDDDDPRNHEDE